MVGSGNNGVEGSWHLQRQLTALRQFVGTCLLTFLLRMTNCRGHFIDFNTVIHVRQVRVRAKCCGRWNDNIYGWETGRKATGRTNLTCSQRMEDRIFITSIAVVGPPKVGGGLLTGWSTRYQAHCQWHWRCQCCLDRSIWSNVGKVMKWLFPCNTCGHSTTTCRWCWRYGQYLSRLSKC